MFEHLREKGEKDPALNGTNSEGQHKLFTESVLKLEEVYKQFK